MTARARVSVSITIPVYNEEQVLAGAVAEIVARLERAGLAFEVILAENGSRDATFAIAQSLAEGDGRVRALHLAAPDYGRAMRQGFLASAGDWLANFSIDFADVEFLQEALAALSQCDVVLGSKYVAGGYDRRPLARRLGGQLLSGFVRLLFGLPVRDTHGLLVLRRERVAPLVEKCRFGHEIFDTELIVRAHRAGLAIRELPVRVEETRPSRLGSFKRAWRMLRQFARLRVALWLEGVW